jgi:hypothetical protein
MTPRFHPSLMAGAMIAALSACAGPPADIADLPKGADGKSRWVLARAPADNPGRGFFFLRGVYVRAPGTGPWGDDITLMDHVHPGDGRAFNVDDGTPRCRFDVRFEMYGYARQSDPKAAWWNLVADDVDLCEMNDEGRVFLPPGELEL